MCIRDSICYIKFTTIETKFGFFRVGLTTPCCQGPNAQPQVSAICGFFFNIEPTPAANTASNRALCGKLNIVQYFEKLDYF